MYRLPLNGKANPLIKGLTLHLSVCVTPIQVVLDCTVQNPSSQVSHLCLEGQGRKILEVNPKFDLLQGWLYNYQLSSLCADPETANIFIYIPFRKEFFSAPS